MQYSPKLKKAMAQINEIIKENDLAAVVLLHTPGHLEYLNRLDPPYSAAFIDHQNSAIRLRSRLMEDYAGNKDLKLRKEEDTVNMIVLITEKLVEISMQWMELHKMVHQRFDIDKGPATDISDTTFNN